MASRELCLREKEAPELSSEQYLLDRIAEFEGKVESLAALKPTLYESLAHLHHATDKDHHSTSTDSGSDKSDEQQVDDYERDDTLTPESTYANEVSQVEASSSAITDETAS